MEDEGRLYLGEASQSTARSVLPCLVDLFYRALPVVFAVNLINGTLFALIFAREVPPVTLAVWYALLLMLTGARGAAWAWHRRYTRTRPVDDGQWQRFRHIAIAGSALSGVLWGSAGWMFYVSEPAAAQVVLGFALGGMAAGALASLASCVWSFYGYLLPCLLPFAVRLALDDGPYHWAMAAMWMVYVVALGLFGWRANRWLTMLVRLRLANSDLVRCLEERVEERTEELRAINERLSRDIVERQRAEATLSDYGQRQAAVAVFGQRALSGISLDALFDEAIALVIRRLRISGGAILEVAGDRKGVRVRATTGWAPLAPVPRVFHPEPGSSISQALSTRSGVICDDAERESRFTIPASLRQAGVRSVVDVVIAGPDRSFGILEAFDLRPGRFSADDVSFLQAIANMLAAAISRKRAESDIQRLALEDSLTGLPNRALFRERLLQELERISHSNRLLALMLLDLDHFKDVNDTLGHPTGDRLLAAVAARLRLCVRDGEPPARLGGDEFALILPGQRDANDVAAIARKVINAVSEPFQIDGHEIRLGASIGITVCPLDGKHPDDLLRNADLALYRAKELGRNTYEFYAVDMAAQVEYRKALERDLRLAIGGDGLDIFYQPQFDLRDGHVGAVEALLRWRHPTRGLLLPDTFIPSAETSGLVVPLGAWVLEKACMQAGEWQQRGIKPFIVAVNLSLSQCRRGDLVASVKKIVERCRSDLRWLELEVTEQTFLPQESAECVDSLRQLQQLGVTVSIDDFGTGYSSLGRLQGLPVDKVKIDRCFVSGLGRSRDAELIVRAMIALGCSLGLEVVAEGVENQAQLDFLRAEGCHGAQGFYLAPPLAPADAERLLPREGVTPWNKLLGLPSPTAAWETARAHLG